MKKRIILVLVVLFMLFLIGCETEHNYSTQYSYDNDYHWYNCEDENCDEVKDKEPHTFNELICDKCGYEKEIEVVPHDHTYNETYQSDETAHYRLCKYEGCTEKTDFENHSFKDPVVEYEETYIINTYVCEVCNYSKQEKIEINNKVEDAVEWDEAFKNFTLTNFEMKVWYDEDGKNMENHCIITDEVVFYYIQDYEKFYSIKNDDFSYTVYEYNFDKEQYIKRNDPEGLYFIGASTETVLRISFATYFDKFVYDEETNTYICEEELVSDALDWDGTPYGQVKSISTKVKVENGKIVSIFSKYTMVYDGVEVGKYASFEYYNIGKAILEIPQEVIDNSIEGNDITEE